MSQDHIIQVGYCISTPVYDVTPRSSIYLSYYTLSLGQFCKAQSLKTSTTNIRKRNSDTLLVLLLLLGMGC